MNNDKNKNIGCCCCQIAVTAATIIVSVVTILGALLTIPNITSANIPNSYRIIAGIANAAWGFTALLGAIAACIESHYLLLPYLVMLVVGLVSLAISSVLSFALIIFSILLPSQGNPLSCMLLFLSANIAFALNFWFLYIIMKCYRNLKERRENFLAANEIAIC